MMASMYDLRAQLTENGVYFFHRPRVFLAFMVHLAKLIPEDGYLVPG
jgi:hypothetical protein